MIGQHEAARLVNRLDCLPFFSALTESGYRELYVAVAQEARSDMEAESAITALLSDVGRAANVDTNRVPSPGELRLWIRAQRDDQYDTPAPISSKRGCGKVFDGWHYEDEDGRHPSHCAGGWVRCTIWREIRGMVNEDGSKAMQPYHFSGRCKCEGGWL